MTMMTPEWDFTKHGRVLKGTYTGMTFAGPYRTMRWFVRDKSGKLWGIWNRRELHQRLEKLVPPREVEIRFTGFKYIIGKTGKVKGKRVKIYGFKVHAERIKSNVARRRLALS